MTPPTCRNGNGSIPAFFLAPLGVGLRSRRRAVGCVPTVTMNVKLDEDLLKWDAAGLVTVVVQDRHSGGIRMVAHANLEALEQTAATGFAHFYSRSRGRLWKKGEESGNVIGVASVRLDCDGDAVLYLSDPQGPSCHTGANTCFFRDVTGSETLPALPTLAALFRTLGERAAGSGGKSYTKSLLEGGVEKINGKITEEAQELCQALSEESGPRVASEFGDLLYHSLVGLLARNVDLRDVMEELSGRFAQSGIEEKASRKGAPHGQ